ncbi:EF-hand domain-containing protein [Desulfovibrio sp.]|uniref:EF-hand domain-containing protein n=1 Tax=Desulfovibrio sp. TaxID=885 RepID=UPI0025BD5F9D|nr:EF-hand domain-containing protein [Desulfovibrio sp.]
MQRTYTPHSSDHSSGPGLLHRLGAFTRLTALGILAGFMLFFHTGEGMAAPGAHKAGHAAHATTGSGDRFAAMDKNGDGKVVIEEFQSASPGMSERAFAVIDSNGDGAIERVEWDAFMKGHAAGTPPQGMAMPQPETAPRLNNIPGDPLIPPPDSADLPLMRPPSGN